MGRLFFTEDPVQIFLIGDVAVVKAKVFCRDPVMVLPDINSDNRYFF
jgi:hypothetical protein